MVNNKKIAIMQPYLFPYIGYFQMLSYVDVFVFYDDVQWIKGGWINRHTMLANNQEKIISLPVCKHSTFSLINTIEIAPQFKEEYLNKIKNAYWKAPFFDDIYPLIEEIINFPIDNISDFILNSYVQLSSKLGLNTELIKSSDLEYNREESAQNKLIDITKKLGAKTYINTIKGEHLYSKDEFEAKGIMLQFMDRVIKPYPQFKNGFVPYLLIIDVLMFNGIDESKIMISQSQLV